MRRWVFNRDLKRGRESIFLVGESYKVWGQSGRRLGTDAGTMQSKVNGSRGSDMSEGNGNVKKVRQVVGGGGRSG